MRPRVTLLVLYTERLDECREFYSGLGLAFVREQHGSGPVHHAAELADGLVLELYPGRPERTTGRLRLGLSVPASDRLPAGDHRFTDPDGRVVVVTATGPDGPRSTG
jgi:catechol 2,3-dioxygenase-like lactoylglutathione lyase family enzyme